MVATPEQIRDMAQHWLRIANAPLKKQDSSDAWNERQNRLAAGRDAAKLLMRSAREETLADEILPEDLSQALTIPQLQDQLQGLVGRQLRLQREYPSRAKLLAPQIAAARKDLADALLSAEYSPGSMLPDLGRSAMESAPNYLKGLAAMVPGGLGDIASLVPDNAKLLAKTLYEVTKPSDTLPFQLQTTEDVGKLLGADTDSLAFLVGSFGLPGLEDAVIKAPAIGKAASLFLASPYWRTGGRPIEVLKNPSETQLLKFWKQKIDTGTGQTEDLDQGFRYLVDDEGNYFFWNAKEAIHDDVIRGLSEEHPNRFKWGSWEPDANTSASDALGFGEDIITKEEIMLGEIRGYEWVLDEARKTALKTAPTVKIRHDNPGGDWLQHEQRRADEAFKKGHKASGSITASTENWTDSAKSPLFIDPQHLKNIPGYMDEHLTRGTGAKAERVRQWMGKEEWRDPITINVNHRGDVYIAEGNNRLAVALEQGIDAVPIRVAWYAGGELADGPFSPKNLEKIIRPPAKPTIRATAKAQAAPVGLMAGQEAPAAEGVLRFRHFRKRQFDTLSPEHMGEGLRGAEAARGPDRPNVLSLYPDSGFTKEVGLGNVEYVIDIPESSMYNASSDSLNLRASAMEPSGPYKYIDGKLVPTGQQFNYNKYEQLIKEKGFFGYHTPDAEGNLRGQARVFYDIPIGK
jgi:hypothetical protein